MEVASVKEVTGLVDPKGTYVIVRLNPTSNRRMDAIRQHGGESATKESLAQRRLEVGYWAPPFRVERLVAADCCRRRVELGGGRNDLP